MHITTTASGCIGGSLDLHVGVLTASRFWPCQMLSDPLRPDLIVDFLSKYVFADVSVQA